MMENPTKKKFDHEMEAGGFKVFVGYCNDDFGEISRPNQDPVLRVI